VVWGSLVLLLSFLDIDNPSLRLPTAVFNPGVLNLHLLGLGIFFFPGIVVVLTLVFLGIGHPLPYADNTVIKVHLTYKVEVRLRPQMTSSVGNKKVLV
jgi:hypothetical protein